MTRIALLFALCLVGCGQTLPDPVITSVTPAQFEQGSAPVLAIGLDAVFPFDVDYGASSAEANAQVSVRLGDLTLALEPFTGGDTIRAIPPRRLDAGTYAVSVVLADGRQGTLEAGVTVTPGKFPASFSIAPIGTQVRGQPFEITITGVGGDAAEFNGVVDLSVNKGNMTPLTSGPFTNGTRVEQVTINAPGQDIVITVTDALGHTGSSNPFRVTN